MRSDPNFQIWLKWLGTIEDDIHRTYFHRDIYRETFRIVDANPRVDGNSLFFAYFQSVYVDSVVMAIRRQLKSGDDSISLCRLLKELVLSPQLVTREEFCAFYPEDQRERGNREFNLFATEYAPYIDPNRVQEDITSLKQTAITVEKYADRRIAHWDRRSPAEISMKEIFDALNEVGRLVERYHLLFNVGSLALSPYPQENVFRIFRVPWIPQHTTGEIPAE